MRWSSVAGVECLASTLGNFQVFASLDFLDEFVQNTPSKVECLIRYDRYAIWIKSNDVLKRHIRHPRASPAGRSPKKPVARYHQLQC